MPRHITKVTDSSAAAGGLSDLRQCPTRFEAGTSLMGVRVHDATVAEPRDVVERVWRDQGPKLWRSLVAFGGDPELASDAMAEAFAQALGRGTDVKEPDRWIWRAAFRIAAGELQRRRRDPVASDLAPTVAMPEPVTDLVRALTALSPNQRAATVLVLYADLPTREVARILGCSSATVRVHVSAARRRLRILLEERDD
jgi:RNA polymerase sigma-70 factor (ECF subfamily)